MASPHPSLNPFGMGPFHSRRSTVMGTRGVVASSQPLASSAGISILEQGGNAADAAVAVAAALNVTEPCSTGIGGDAFCLFWDAEKRQVRGLNASGRSPAAMSLDSLKKAGVTDGIGLQSVHSVTVPGAAASWVDTVEKFGSGKLTLEDILAPAIRLADGGYPVHEITSKAWVASEAKIKAASPNGDEMMLPGSKRAPKQGEIMRMPNLARTFREVAIKGKAGYYKGRIAQAIVDVLKQKGGLMELEDLAKHAEVGSEEITPISYEYGNSGPNAHDGVTLHECPPNGQGLVALVGLGVIDSLRRQGKIGDVARMEHNSAEYLHTLIEALRFGFADAHQWVCDPAHGGLDRVESMLSEKYLDEQSKIFDPKKLVHIAHGNPESSSNTVYFSVTDGQGNACSFIMSNYTGFGSCIVPKDCGFTLQNRGSDFKMDPAHSNCVAPSKRPYHTIIPAMATRRAEDGKPELFLSFGVMGGFMQPQGQIQVLLNILRGHTPQAALDAPRFCIGTGMRDKGPIDSTVYLEEGIADSVAEELRQKGHTIVQVHGWDKRDQFGRGQVIMRAHDGGSGRKVWVAGSDPRGDGNAIAQV